MDSSSSCLPSLPLPAHHRIESLTLERSLLFNDFHLDFSPGVTVLFGGRGTGKSALLEILGFVLDSSVLPHGRASHESHVRAALGGGKAIVSIVTQYGVRYRVERRWGEAAKVFSEDGAVVEVPLRAPLFKVEVYGQKVIEEVGRHEGAKRALIDAFAEAETQRLEEEIARVRALLAENADEQRRLTARIEEHEAGIMEIPALARALAGLDVAAGLAEAEATRQRERKGARGRERRAIAEVKGAVAAAREEISGVAAAASRRIAGAIEAALEEGPSGAAFGAAHAAARGARGAIEAAAAKLRTELAAFEEAIAAAAKEVQRGHDQEEEAYHAFVARSDASLARAAERQTLHLRLEELSARKRRTDELEHELGERKAARAALLKEQERLVLAIRGCRQGTAARLNEPLAGAVTVSIDDAGDDAAYKELLTDLLKKCGARPDIAALARAFRPLRLAALARANDPGPLEEADPKKTDRAERAAKIVAALAGSERLRELESIRTQDSVLLELTVHGKPVASEKASVGQRCTCVIEVLLVPATAGLVVDQIEDHLDGAFIYQVLVRKLREQKKNRQFILVSHNPNIAALAEAEKVALLGVDEKGLGHVAAQGTYREMAGKIEGWLEGGSEAFLRRGELYGHFARKSER